MPPFAAFSDEETRTQAFDPRVLLLRSRLSKRPARACRRYGTIVVLALLKAASRTISPLELSRSGTRMIG